MEYNHNPSDPIHMILAHLTDRLNRQDRAIAQLRSDLRDTDSRAATQSGDQVAAGAIDQAIEILERAEQCLRSRLEGQGGQ